MCAEAEEEGAAPQTASFHHLNLNSTNDSFIPSVCVRTCSFETVHPDFSPAKQKVDFEKYFFRLTSCFHFT